MLHLRVSGDQAIVFVVSTWLLRIGCCCSTSKTDG